MRDAKPVFWIAAALAILASQAVAAPNDKLEAMLRKLPSDCVVVAGAADAPVALAAVRRWAEPLLRTLGNPEASAALGMMLDSAAGILDGPAVVGVAEGGAFHVLVGTGTTQGEVVLFLQGLGLECRMDGDVVGVGSRFRDVAVFRIKDGVIALAPNALLLDALLSPPVPGEPTLLDLPDGAALMRPDELREASLFAFKTRWLPDLFGPTRQPDPMAFMRRLIDAVIESCHLDAPLVARLHIGEKELRLTGAAALPPTPPLGTAAVMAPLPEDSIYGSWGWLPDLNVLIGGMEAAMDVVDRDIAMEFRTEMAELDADLGYDFRQDFLANLGPDWAETLVPAAGGPQWMIVCGLRDREQFIRCAEGLARLAGERWTEGTPEGAIRHFSTRAFTIPLELAVAEHRVFVATSTAALRRSIEAAGKPEGLRPEPGAAWEAHGLAHVPELIAVLAGNDAPPERGMMLLLLKGARIGVDVRRQGERLEYDVRLDGITPEQLDLFAGPVDPGRMP